MSDDDEYPEATPDRVEREVRRLARKLEEHTDQLAARFTEAGEAEVAYRVAYARAFLQSDETSDRKREADAISKCEGLLRDRLAKQAVADAAKEAGRALQTQISAVQSVGRLLTSQMDLARGT